MDPPPFDSRHGRPAGGLRPGRRALSYTVAAIALGVVVVMVIATVVGVVPLAVGVAAHEGSTVVVCLNSLRILFAKE